MKENSLTMMLSLIFFNSIYYIILYYTMLYYIINLSIILLTSVCLLPNIPNPSDFAIVINRPMTYG